jgi:hypothetical protein
MRLFGAKLGRVQIRRGLLLCPTLLLLAPLLCQAAIPPSDWVPARWPWRDAKSLELIQGSPINCLLLDTWAADLPSAAAKRGLITLAVIVPQQDAAGAARRALAAGITGIVLEGDFPEGTAGAVKSAAGSAPVIELTSRSRMMFGNGSPILGTYQGLWPGVAVQDDGAKRAGPSGSVWIDTNTGFLRAARAWGDATIWIANRPPEKTIVAGTRYLQVIADAAASGARWVIALDADLAARLERRDAGAVKDFGRINAMMGYFERHPEWRRMREFGRLAIVQDTAKGGLVSGGILDMIAVKHTPVEPIPSQHLNSEALKDATMAVNVEGEDLTEAQKQILLNFAHGGGMLLTAPSGWKDRNPGGDKITLDKAELDRLGEIWKEVNSMIGRRNLGVRLFNVSTMLSNVLASPDSNTEVVQLVNYSDFPVEDVTVHYLGNFQKALLTSPDGTEKALTPYETEDGWGVDIDRVSVCATIRLEKAPQQKPQ